ncbi:LPP20 family lipoprotein [bacterium]|nr:LPP20 family lipoprotein [bacterium]NUN44812.1 LPP20 family lipoprotein [bacterium]
MKSVQMFLISSLLIFMSCGGGKATSKNENKIPKWVSKPGLYEDVIVAAGIGEGLSEQKAKSQAEQNGRKKIAEALQTQVKSLTTNFMEEAGTTTEKGTESAAQEYFQEVTQTLTNITLNGAVLEEYWPPMGEKDGNRIKFYAKMVLKKSSLVDEFKKKVADDIAQKKIKNVKASADEALKALDKAIGKWEKTSESAD